MPLLNGWKEISQYAGRAVRTVQRWERSYGFPVHRPKGDSPSAVLAITDEIDTWGQASRRRQVDEIAELKAEIESLKAELKVVKSGWLEDRNRLRPPERLQKSSRPMQSNGLASAGSLQD